MNLTKSLIKVRSIAHTCFMVPRVFLSRVTEKKQPRNWLMVKILINYILKNLVQIKQQIFYLKALCLVRPTYYLLKLTKKFRKKNQTKWQNLVSKTKITKLCSVALEMQILRAWKVVLRKKQIVLQLDFIRQKTMKLNKFLVKKQTNSRLISRVTILNFCTICTKKILHYHFQICLNWLFWTSRSPQKLSAYSALALEV